MTEESLHEGSQTTERTQPKAKSEKAKLQSIQKRNVGIKIR